MNEKPVVVGYNGKQHSQDALEWAVVEATRRGAPLLVLFAANYPGMALGPGPGLLEYQPGALDAAEEVTARGVAAARTARPRLLVSGRTRVTSPSKTLIEASSEAALLVIGTRGFGSVLGAMLGSVAFTVAGRASCPVIVVKTDGLARAPRQHDRVVVGTDGSPLAANALEFAADFATATSAALEVVSTTGEEPVPGAGIEGARTSAENILVEAIASVRTSRPGLEVHSRVEDGPAEQTLVDASERAGLVVVGSRGRGTFEGLLLGSVSHAVIHGAHCPVAVVGAPASSLTVP